MGGKREKPEDIVLKLRQVEVLQYRQTSQRTWVPSTCAREYHNTGSKSHYALTFIMDHLIRAFQAYIIFKITFFKISCSIPDDHIDPRRSALFMARSVLRDIQTGGTNACSTS